MIIVASSSSREASILSTLCDYRKWPCQSCALISDFSALAEKANPRAVVIRQQLQDGYSDDILAFLKRSQLAKTPGIIVLAAANCSAASEARQIALGADVVLRDPVRIPVLLEYLGKYQTVPAGKAASSVEPVSWSFATVEIYPDEHRIALGGQSLHVAPQEIALLRMLNRSQGKVISYSMLYDELFNRRFGGDTTNCRVLLGKLGASFKKLGIVLRDWIRVIPKSGYLYTAPIQKHAAASKPPRGAARVKKKARLKKPRPRSSRR